MARDMDTPVPLILSSFPVPPSYIPPSPFTPITNVNPPPTLPPSSPLPPVPGPSPITEQETLSFISAARSRRASKLSLASSTYSRRDSTATLASNASGSSVPSLSPSISITPHDSTRSLRSFPSTGSLSIPSPSRFTDISPILEPRICEEDPTDLTRLSLDDISFQATTPDHDLTDDEQLLEFGVLPLPASLSASQFPGTSLAAYRDPELPVSAPPTLSSHCFPRPALRKSLLDKDLPPLPLADPTCSAPVPAPAPRPDSPDIGDIIAATPRLRRKSMSSGLRSRSRSRPALKRHGSEGFAALHNSTSCRTSRTSLARSRPGSPSRLPYLHGPPDEPYNDDSFASDYGVPLDATGSPVDTLDPEEEELLERELEGDGGSDTDSSLDIHTPLPNLMLRDGLLSPNSKLLPHTVGSTSPLPGGRPGSLLSVTSDASVMTKSGLYKDSRNTVQRRIRHRDGKLLREGIGLTTGLGWSDSEDEDAPSPLTSSLITRKSLPKSFKSRPHPLSRSISAPTSDLRSSYNPPSEPLPVLKSRTSLPPASLQRRDPSGADRRTSTGSSASSASSALGIQPRASMSSLRSVPSSSRIKPSVPLSHINEREEASVDLSSSSSASSPMPITPVASEDGRLAPRKSLPNIRSRADSGSGLGAPLGPAQLCPTHKAVPRPLRLPQAHGSPRPPSGASGVRPPSGASGVRPPSGASGVRFPLASAGSLKTVQGIDRLRMSPGGLQPPRATSLSSRSPRPSVLSSAGDPAVQPAASPRPSPATLEPAAQAAKPKPRTGTGMAYRSSSRPSLMRMPSQPMIRTA